MSQLGRYPSGDSMHLYKKYSMRIATISFLLLSWTLSLSAQTNYTDLSKTLLENIKAGSDLESSLKPLQGVAPKTLSKELDTEDKKKAFWINIYNAHILMILNKQPALFEQRPGFFKEKQIHISQEVLSFEDIEHGILRRSKNPLGLGILPKFFPTKFERQMRVKKVDPRIHFALNCGAKSCPPVAAYDYRSLEDDLEVMSLKYLQENTQFDEANHTLLVPRLLSWFSADFGLSKKKKLAFLGQYITLPEDTSKLKLDYLEYDWTLALNNFSDWLD